MQALESRAALVLGGSRGIGSAIVRRLADEGAAVAFTYLSAGDQARALVAELDDAGQKGLAIRADSADPQALRTAVERTVGELGGIDILVNNAGVFPWGDPESFTLEEIDRALAIHARAAFVSAQFAIGHMGGGGRIINIGSCLVERVPVPGISLYSMSKAALSGLTRGLARDLGPRGITVNLVHPGPTDTDMNPADGDGADEERALTALGRYGRGADIAGAVAYLASDDGAWVTGTSITVDGGYAA